MAISFEAEPQTLQPAYNEIKWIVDSTNKSIDGFRYVFDIYEAGTSNKIAEYKIIPRIGDAFGELDISRLIQNFVSYTFDESSDTKHEAVGSYYLYDIKFGEEFFQDIDYTNALTDDGGNVNITVTHSFVVGDQVTIIQDDGGAANPNLEGLFTVVAINGTTDFTVNSLFSEVTDINIDGSVSYSDKRKTITRDLQTRPDQKPFNGAVTFSDFSVYDSSIYGLDDATDCALTTLPTEFHATLEQNMWLNWDTKGNANRYVYFENDQGNIFRKFMDLGVQITQTGVAPNNTGSLTLFSGGGNLIESDTIYYDVYAGDVAGTQLSKKYRIILDKRCKINEYQVSFLDRLGSIGSFTFSLRDKLTGEVDKDVYNQNIEGQIESGEWTYDRTAQGRKVINPSVEETYELNTDWMTEDEAAYFAELVSSPNTWILIGEFYFSCIIVDTKYEKERQRNRNLIRKTIKLKLSVQDRVNG